MAQFGFDDLMQADAEMHRDPRPFWAVVNEDDKVLLKWLNGEVNFLKEDATDRIDQVRKGIANYKGIQYESQPSITHSTADIGQENKSKVDKIVVNHLYDLTESHVSRAVKYRPGIDVSPANPEDMNDVIGAKMKKALIDHIWYETEFREGIFPLVVRDSKVAGEDYLFVLWDRESGDVSPAYEKAKKAGKQSVVLSNGETVSLDRPVMQGDVEYRQVSSADVFLQKKKKYLECEYLFWKEEVNVDDLKSEYPKMANDIVPDKDDQTYDYENLSIKKDQNTCFVYNFFHCVTGKVASGSKIRFIKDKILEREDLGLDHGRLPAVRLTDIDIPNERHGISYFRNIRPLTNIYNNMTNMINRNQILCGHPKWVMPAGACRLEQLGNDITIVQFKGPIAPQLVSMSPTGKETFEFRKDIKEEFQVLAGVHGVSRGEPPPGVKAGVAMQFLNEQENDRANVFMLKVNAFIRDVADLTIQTVTQFYKESDERMIKVVGNSNKWMVERFDTKWLSGEYDVRVANSSALPESKSQRTQNILDLSERFPGMFTNEQVVEMLDLGQSEKMISAATIAIRAAEVENEDLMDGKKVLPPEEYESHIDHWRVHSRMFQSPGFKNMSKALKQKAIDHMMATEMFIFEYGKKNPLFQQKAMAELALFPMFYFDETMMATSSIPGAPPAASAAMSAAMPGGEAPQMSPPVPEQQQEVSLPPGAPMGVNQ